MTDKDQDKDQDELINKIVANMASFMPNNLVADSGIRQRVAAIMSGGYDFADTLHNVYLDYGYPARTEFFHYWNMYRRFGMAARVVNLYPELGWKDKPTIVAPDAVLKDLNKIISRINFYHRMRGLDVRNRVGRYAGMFMRVRDGLTPDQPLEGTLPGEAALMDMVPLYESQLHVTEVQTDPTADDYGMPIMYQFRGTEPGNRNPDVVSSFNIHPSRVIIAAEGSDNGGIYGISSLENVYNSLMDLRKIIGAGGEGFYKNAAQSVIFTLKDAASAATNPKALDKLNENFDDFQRNRMRRSMWTPGLDPTVLTSNLANPKEHFNNALNDVSAGSGIPSKFIIGTQTGVLAGDADGEYLLSNVQSRRNGFQTEMLAKSIRWMMDHGILPDAEFEIEWPDALAPSDSQKLQNADKMADINQKAFNSGQSPVFTAEQIIVAAGYEPEELEEPDESLDDDIDETLEDEPEDGQDES